MASSTGHPRSQLLTVNASTERRRAAFVAALNALVHTPNVGSWISALQKLQHAQWQGAHDPQEDVFVRAYLVQAVKRQHPHLTSSVELTPADADLQALIDWLRVNVRTSTAAD
ncbi:hypothetical protein SEPCBS119000_004837 [Sporothrix epigloea]|uniref:Uncharacterized protein n=1 Tax=Sporothrix epigloea TaxID=1892477 RepID=A0ABP0DW73_9PEZI